VITCSSVWGTLVVNEGPGRGFMGRAGGGPLGSKFAQTQGVGARGFVGTKGVKQFVRGTKAGGRRITWVGRMLHAKSSGVQFNTRRAT